MLNVQGLKSSEAEKRLQKYGKNELPKKSPPSSFILFLSQFKNPLVYILLVAGLVTVLLGDHTDSVIILLVVMVNAVLGFVQEKKASTALESLKSLIQPSVDVYRDGNKLRIGIEMLVPGDIVQLEPGEKIPADGKLIKANRLFISEAVLTGESVPVEKLNGDEAYMGTGVASGEGLMEVSMTGAGTQMGSIAMSVQKPQEDTPMTKQLKHFSNQLTVLILVLTAVVFVVGTITGKELVEVFKTSVALAVSSIPEGLLIALTVVLALGMQRILAKKGLVRNLVSAETLGGVTTICIDKTGTLTQGELKVVEATERVDEVCPEHFAFSDDPIMKAAREWLSNIKVKNNSKKNYEGCELLDSIPFTSQKRFYASLIRHKDGRKEVYVGGAPEQLLDWSEMKAAHKKKIRTEITSIAGEGKRIIALAKKEVPRSYSKISEEDIGKGLVWLGLLVFSDPVREGAAEALEKAEQAGLKTILITGDYSATAVAVLDKLKIKVDNDRIILGDELENFSDKKLAELIETLQKKNNSIIVFARTKPEQKLKVINALKMNGEVVAMMGDGVNDAPALHNADIGIVVEEATDVAKESASMILLDSSFQTIIDSIREGRGIFDNLRKVILYLMCDAFGEIITVIAAMLLGFPLPVTAIQILWINVVSDGFPHLALTVDPHRSDIMKTPPRDPDEQLINNWMKIIIIIVSVSASAVALAVFVYTYSKTSDLLLARSLTFATLGANSLVYVFSVRTLRMPFWKESPFRNRWLNLAVIAGAILQFLPFSSATLRGFFGLYPLTIIQWSVVIGASFLMFCIIEAAKVVFRLRKLNIWR